MHFINMYVANLCILKSFPTAEIHHGWYDATSLIVTDSLGALSSAKKTDTNVMYTAEQASVKFGIQELEKNENENMKLLNAVPSIHRKQGKFHIFLGFKANLH